MQWNEYLADAFMGWFLVVPALLVATKLAFPLISWTGIWLSAAGSSWVTGLAVFWAFPPNNGLANAVMLLTGWFYMLPVLVLMSVFYRWVRRWEGSRGARAVCYGLLFVTLVLPVSACLRWIPQSKAREIAIVELRKFGHTDYRIREVKRTWGGWTVHVEFPDQPDYPVHVSRSGHFNGMGDG